MFGRRPKNPPFEKIETVLGENTNFRGTMKCDGGIRIDGVFEDGSLETVGNVIIGPKARIGGNIIAENVSVSGSVTGTITAYGRLEILSTGKVWGDASVGSFLLDENAFFKGKLEMRKAEEGAEPVDLKVENKEEPEA
jgi:cytoskeletal protein CcmA (bactofilin family)